MSPPRRPPLVVIALAVIGFAFFAVPLGALLQQARWSTFIADITTGPALRALRLSIVCALIAAAASVVLGLPLAWVLARVAIPARRIVRGIVLLPMVLPPVVGGVALLSAFSLRSPIGGWLHSWFGVQLTFAPAGVVVAQTFVAMPFFVITAEAALRNVDRGLEEAASGLGAGPSTVFRRVTLPLIAPSLAAATVLAWARALGEFGATITFAGNISGRTQTLPLDAYLQLETDRGAAIALSLVLVAVSLASLVAMRDRWLVRS